MCVKVAGVKWVGGGRSHKLFCHLSGGQGGGGNIW